MAEMMARIHWKTPEEGGRKSIPPGPRYSTPARFRSAWDDWDHGAWSLVVDKSSELEGTKDWIASVRFLFEDGPQHLLVEGAEFELFEGQKSVAIGKVFTEKRNTIGNVGEGVVATIRMQTV